MGVTGGHTSGTGAHQSCAARNDYRIDFWLHYNFYLVIVCDSALVGPAPPPLTIVV